VEVQVYSLIDTVVNSREFDNKVKKEFEELIEDITSIEDPTVLTNELEKNFGIIVRKDEIEFCKFCSNLIEYLGKIFL